VQARAAQLNITITPQKKMTPTQRRSERGAEASELSMSATVQQEESNKASLTWRCRTALFSDVWRRERDSNPRSPLRLNGFQDRRFQPLTHLSAATPIIRKSAPAAASGAFAPF
jgi:hypothetical protein